MSMNNMGKSIPETRKRAAYLACKSMGLDSDTALRAVNTVGLSLERDDPHMAQVQGMKFLDITGVYRLFAHLLTEQLNG